MTINEMLDLVAAWNAKQGKEVPKSLCPQARPDLGERLWRLIEEANGCEATLEELFIAELEEKNREKAHNL